MSLARKYEETFDSDEEEDDQLSSTAPLGQRICAKLTKIAYMTKVFAKLNLNEIRRRKGTFCLGLFSCLLVVIITALMLTTLKNLPVLFLRLGESEDGEMDLILYPGGEVSLASSLNYTIVKELFPPGGPRSLHTPRVTWKSAMLYRMGDCRNPTGDSYNTSYLWSVPPGDSPSSTCSSTVGCISKWCASSESKSTNLVWLDLVREQEVGIGREYPVKGPLAANEIVLSVDAALALGVTHQDVVVVFMQDASKRLLQAFQSAGMQQPNQFGGYGRFPTVIFAAQVVGIVGGPKGKFPTDFTNYAIADFKNIIPAVAAGFSPIVPSYMRDSFAAVDSDVVAEEIIFNFPPESRLSMYGHSDNADVQRDAITFASPIISQLGFNQLSVEMPIVSFMFESRFFALFLGLILSIIILGLSCLSIILIYSLLVVGVDTKAFELAVLRMVGMTRFNVVAYVLTNATAFAIPAWIFGLIIAQLLFLWVRSLLKNLLDVDVPPSLTADAVGFATLGAIGIPMLSAIAPMFDVLSQQLPSALDTNRGKVTTIKYDMERSTDRAVDWLLVGLGVALVVFGFLIYYIFPQALLTFNITLLFYIFFGLLVGMLFGFVLLAINFERLMERLVTYLFFFWEADAVFDLIEKNMTAHRRRNRKTTLMYAMALGFIIFVTMAFQIQLDSVQLRTRLQMGGDIRLSRGDDTMSFAEVSSIEALLFSAELRPMWSAYNWVGARMTRNPTIANTSITTLGRLQSSTSRPVAIPPNFFEATDNTFLRITQEDSDSPYSLAEQLYTVEGSGGALVGHTYRSTFALDSLASRFMSEVTSQDVNNSRTTKQVIRPVAFLSLCPALRYSRFPGVSAQNLAMSVPQYLRRSTTLNSFQQMRFQSAIVMAGDEANVKALANKLKNLLTRAGSGIQVQDYYEETSNLDTAKTVVNFFFIFTQVMSMIICFFALMSSMAANVHEQAKEIGILRALGMKVFPLKRLYIEEAFVIVVSASLMGIVVGVGVAYTMSIQQALFNQLPLPFIFPWQQLVTVCVVAVIGAFVSSYGPITALLNAPSIPHILRRTF